MLLLLHLLLARGRLALLDQLVDLRQGLSAILTMASANSCVALARPGALSRASVPRRWSVDVLEDAIVHGLGGAGRAAAHRVIIVVVVADLAVGQHVALT